MMKNLINSNNQRWRIFLIAIIILAFTFSASENGFGQDQDNNDWYHWEFSIGGIAYYVSTANNWNFGPELVIQYSFKPSWGLYAGFSYPSTRMTSKGYGFREGLPIDVGLYLTPVQSKVTLKYGPGFSYIFGSDSDGSQLKELGVHISGHLSYWFSNKLGVYLRGILRLWLGDRHGQGSTSPSLSAGMGFRF